MSNKNLVQKKFVLGLIVFFVLLSGCQSRKNFPNQHPTVSQPLATRPEAVTQVRDIEYIPLEKNENFDNESWTLIDKKQSPDGNFTYEYYSKEGIGCDMYAEKDCYLAIFDNQTGDVVKELYTKDNSEKPFFFLFDGVPSGWYDNENLIVIDSYGDSCVFSAKWKKYNIETEAISLLASQNASCIPGRLITLESYQSLLFDFSSPDTRELRIFEVLDNSIDLYKHDEKYTCVNEYWCKGLDPKRPVLSNLKLKKTFSLSEDKILVKDEWKGIFFEANGGKQYQYLPEINEIVELGN